MKSHRADSLKDAIKALLKQKRFGYADVALRLKTSVPTVKRILGPEELSLSRLLELCEWLEISLADLEAFAGLQATSGRESLTMEQENFFVEHPAYLSYLSHLHGGASPEKIAKDYQLTARSTELYLLRLEKHGMLRRDAKGRVHLSHREFPSVIPDGPVIRAQYKHIIQQTSDLFKRLIFRVLGDSALKAKSKTYLGFASFEVSRKTASAWIEKLEEMQVDFARQASLEEKLGNVQDPCQVVVSHMHTLLNTDDPEIETIKTTLGKIVNIEKKADF